MDKKWTRRAQRAMKVLAKRLHSRLCHYESRAMAEEKGHDGDHGKSVGVSCICVSVSFWLFLNQISVRYVAKSAALASLPESFVAMRFFLLESAWGDIPIRMAISEDVNFFCTSMQIYSSLRSR